MIEPRSREDAGADRRRELLSELADGQCDAGRADEALRAWKDDERWRRDWRTYHLIGDALRSDELAAASGQDEVFLQALRKRLASEPVPLAPVPLVRAQPSSRRWLSAAAMVAGVGVVGVSVLALRPTGSEGGGGWSQARTAVVEPGGALQRVGSPAPAASQMLLIDGDIIRDARLDAYFEAHRRVLDAMPSTMPGGVLRSVEALSAPR